MLHRRHPDYSWVTMTEGGFASAAERQDIAAQTISAQVRELKSMDPSLKPFGRRIAKADASPPLLTWLAAASAR